MNTIEISLDALTVADELMEFYLLQEDSDENFYSIGLLTVVLEELSAKILSDNFNA